MSEQEVDTQEAKPGFWGSAKSLWLLGGVLVLATGVMAGLNADDDPPQDSTYSAERTCEGWVKEQLKAPSTAKFSGTSSSGGAGGPWVVTGDVDAENSFGAALRSKWTCEIRLEGDTFKGRSRLLE